MKKKITVIIIGSCLLLIPITVFATKKIGIEVEKVMTEEEFNEQRKQEKENWINEHKLDTSTYSTVNKNAKIDTELIDKYERGEKEANNSGKAMEEIINKFYKDEYKILSAKIAENSDNMSLNELYSQAYTEELFNIIMDIILNKDITSDEKAVLKEFLNDQYYFLKEGSEMKSKFEEILKEE